MAKKGPSLPSLPVERLLPRRERTQNPRIDWDADILYRDKESNLFWFVTECRGKVVQSIDALYDALSVGTTPSSIDAILHADSVLEQAWGKYENAVAEYSLLPSMHRKDLDVVSVRTLMFSTRNFAHKQVYRWLAEPPPSKVEDRALKHRLAEPPPPKVKVEDHAPKHRQTEPRQSNFDYKPNPKREPPSRSPQPESAMRTSKKIRDPGRGKSVSETRSNFEVHPDQSESSSLSESESDDRNHHSDQSTVTEDSDEQNLGRNPSVNSSTSNRLRVQSSEVARTVEFTLLRAVERMNITYSMKFDGTSADYPRFIVYWNEKFGQSSFTDAENLSHLILSTTGKANKCVAPYEGTRDGLNQALHELKRLFGQPYDIVKSAMDRMTSGARLKLGDVDGLQDYAIALQSGYATLRSQHATTEANVQSYLVRVFNKLPASIQAKWLKKNQDIRDNKGRDPKFRELMDFVVRQSEMTTCHFKVQSDKPPSQNPNFQSRPKVTTMLTLSPDEPVVPVPTTKPAPDATKPPVWRPPPVPGQGKSDTGADAISKCPCCRKRDHLLMKDCRKFAEMPVGKRRWMAKMNKVCYACFDTSHHRQRCPHNVICSMPGCGGNHHTLLHQDPREPTDATPGGKTSNQGQAGSPSGAVPAANQKKPPGEVIHAMVTTKPRSILLHIIPVRVSAESGKVLTTYAMIDSGAQNTMVNHTLSEKLGLSGIEEEIDLTTVLARDPNYKVTSLAFTLESVAAENKTSISVVDAMCVDSLPLGNLPKPRSLDLSEWPHLQSLDLST